MSGPARLALADCLRAYPAAVVEVSPDGVVQGSNGRFEDRLAGPVVGRTFADLLEASSKRKWLQVLESGTAMPRRIELALDGPTTFTLGTFLVTGEGVGLDRRLWLLEQPAEMQEAALYEEISAINADLAGAQRELARERVRLQRALAAEEAAGQAAEAARRRVSAIEGVGKAALAHGELDPLLADVLDRVREALAVDAANVLLLDSERTELRLRASVGLPDRRWDLPVPVGQGMAGRAVLGTEAVAAEDLSAVDVVRTGLRDHLASLADAPLVLPDRVIGVLEVGTFRRRAFTPDDLSLLEELEARLALAIERHRRWEGERAARAAAQAAVLQRDEVLAIVAHDLRNPLGRILMGVTVLRNAMPAGTDPRPLDVVQRAIQSMDRLIRDLLDVSRLEAGGLPLDRSAVTVEPLLSDLCEQFGELARSKQVRLEWAVDGGLPPVLADRARLAQATSNLLDNAIRLTPAGGEVTVRATWARDLVEFAVADTGPGIAPEQLPHLFDRFWQGPRERRGSAGLGLTIVKGIVEAHGGRLFVESTVGEGTTFRFWIPVAV